MGEDGKGQKPVWVPDTVAEWVFWIFVVFVIMIIMDLFVFPGRDLLGEISPWLDKAKDFVVGMIGPLKDVFN